MRSPPAWTSSPRCLFGRIVDDAIIGVIQPVSRVDRQALGRNLIAKAGVIPREQTARARVDSQIGSVFVGHADATAKKLEIHRQIAGLHAQLIRPRSIVKDCQRQVAARRAKGCREYPLPGVDLPPSTWHFRTSECFARNRVNRPSTK